MLEYHIHIHHVRFQVRSEWALQRRFITPPHAASDVGGDNTNNIKKKKNNNNSNNNNNNNNNETNSDSSTKNNNSRTLRQTLAAMAATPLNDDLGGERGLYTSIHSYIYIYI